ncbi:GIY-YIG nuclease family protein [Gracilimonas sp.]|uniref:GIY-YIG nuclease family protein n=1 Tax=Gracilimonas sp. TaxID=1974203 RepID=UPI0032EAB251
MRGAYVYILSNIGRTTLYIGVTKDISRRVWEHKQGKGSTFTAKYKCTILLYTEEHGTISDAIEREKQLKNWRKAWKWDLIKTLNPDLVDLYPILRG